MTLIPFDDRDGEIWLDGDFIPWRDAKLHVLSHGLHYGGSVFEGERVYDGEIFKLREHSERLIKSAAMLDMKITQSVEEIDEATKEVVKRNNIVDGYVRPIAWRGAEQMAVSGQHTKIHVAIACWEWPKYFRPEAQDGGGIALMTTKWRRPDPTTAPVQAKACGNYAIGTMAKHEAERAGFDDVLMHDYKGRVAESSGSNLFCVKDGHIKTPVPESFLNGITRQTVMGIAKDLGYTVEETTIMPDELADFDEIFITGTAIEVTPIGKIDDMEFEVGPITTKIKETYLAMVRQKQTVDA